ncbi:unnamed protein product [Spirodela intermedia]|uniref:Uncharacterized protein n=1 Tax=Spirodela intermedia TaxID=51605 RepID=A0A7I8J373_SPIIN|nr:unnamed protein product [Spirodela intermedia]CAA6664422.1 unnamed protein product [Spirodela intermedia]
MGGATSKSGDDKEALVLCRERMRLIRQAVDLRYSLSAAHLSYIQSLRSLGIALRRFAEAELPPTPLSPSPPTNQTIPLLTPLSPLLLPPAPSPPAARRRRRPRRLRAADPTGTSSTAAGKQEDPSEFITHRAKEFLSGMKEIEGRFLRAADCGGEITRMLEATKIKLGALILVHAGGGGDGGVGGSSPPGFLSALQISCCKKAPTQRLAKVITWNRSASSASSSSKKTLTAAAAAARPDLWDGGGDFAEEFCMISGSHSSTMDRLYAWERKLYDEVKASESIRRQYDRRCCEVRQRSARELNGRAVDRARAAARDLHSQVRVAINAVDSISSRVEALRDHELLPQLMELIQGLGRMWKAMLECHHAQFITISLAYHAKAEGRRRRQGGRREAMGHLWREMEFFGRALRRGGGAAAAGPGEGRRAAAFSPRRALAPPIFVLCRDWLAAATSLPAGELSAAVAALAADLAGWCRREEEADEEEKKKKKKLPAVCSEAAEHGGRLLLAGEQQCEQEDLVDHPHHHRLLQMGLARLFDRLTKFSEASLKAYEDITRAAEIARAAYASYRTRT